MFSTPVMASMLLSSSPRQRCGAFPAPTEVLLQRSGRVASISSCRPPPLLLRRTSSLKCSRLPSSPASTPPPSSSSDQNNKRDLPSGRINWLLLNDIEFEDCLETISTSTGPDCSKMCWDEFKDFCKRRGQFVSKGSDRLTELVGDVDLITPLKAYRARFSCRDGDLSDDLELPSYIPEKFEKSDKQRASNL